MKISFCKLSVNDFPIILKWLETPHVKAWWDTHISWNLEKITEKYQSYVAGFKLEGGERKTIFAYIIAAQGRDVGYIQYYSAHDFLMIPNTPSFQGALAAIDFYIGESDLLGHGIGSHALSQFMDEVVFKHFDAALVTPDIKNIAAIGCYQKAGFIPVLEQEEKNELWLINRKGNER